MPPSYRGNPNAFLRKRQEFSICVKIAQSYKGRPYLFLRKRVKLLFWTTRVSYRTSCHIHVDAIISFQTFMCAIGRFLYYLHHGISFRSAEILWSCSVVKEQWTFSWLSFLVFVFIAYFSWWKKIWSNGLTLYRSHRSQADLLRHWGSSRMAIKNKPEVFWNACISVICSFTDLWSALCRSVLVLNIVCLVGEANTRTNECAFLISLLGYGLCWCTAFFLLLHW